MTEAEAQYCANPGGAEAYEMHESLSTVKQAAEMTQTTAKSRLSRLVQVVKGKARPGPERIVAAVVSHQVALESRRDSARCT